MSNNYYEKSAFNSKIPRELANVGEGDRRSKKQKLIRLNTITSRGLHSKEYLSYIDLDFIELLNDDSDEVKEEKNFPAHEKQVWDSLKNPRATLEVISRVLTFFWVVSLFGIGLGYVATKFDVRVIQFAAIWPGLPFIVDRFIRVALKKNWVQDKNNIIVNRRTGLVTFTWEKERIILPFDEFDVCMPMGTRPTGSHDYYLRFVHKYSDKWFQAPAGRDNAWEVEQDWEFWQQYMDISKPLPDTPNMEPFRHRDPVTAEWDKKHNRPKDYWKNLDMEKAKEMKRKSRKAAENFPWGSTREEAIASGWKPSNVGQGDWQK